MKKKSVKAMKPAKTNKTAKRTTKAMVSKAALKKAKPAAASRKGA